MAPAAPSPWLTLRVLSTEASRVFDKGLRNATEDKKVTVFRLYCAVREHPGESLLRLLADSSTAGTLLAEAAAAQLPAVLTASAGSAANPAAAVAAAPAAAPVPSVAAQPEGPIAAHLLPPTSPSMLQQPAPAPADTPLQAADASGEHESPAQRAQQAAAAPETAKHGEGAEQAATPAKQHPQRLPPPLAAISAVGIDGRKEGSPSPPRSPACVLRTPSQSSNLDLRRCLFATHNGDGADCNENSSNSSGSSSASVAGSVAGGSLCSHPVTAGADDDVEAQQAEQDPDGPNRNRLGARVTRFALRAAAALVPIVAATAVHAATGNGGGGAHGWRRQQQQGQRKRGRQDDHKVESKRWSHPRQVPFLAPKPSALVPPK